MSLNVTIGNSRLSVAFGGQSMSASTGIPVARDATGVDPYTGEYEVTPLADSAVILPTNGLRMTDDVTVHKVPYYETSNPSGGYTAYIAMEV